MLVIAVLSMVMLPNIAIFKNLIILMSVCIILILVLVMFWYKITGSLIFARNRMALSIFFIMSQLC